MVAESKTYRCELCSYTTQNRYSMGGHMKGHGGRRQKARSAGKITHHRRGTYTLIGPSGRVERVLLKGSVVLNGSQGYLIEVLREVK